MDWKGSLLLLNVCTYSFARSTLHQSILSMVSLWSRRCRVNTTEITCAQGASINVFAQRSLTDTHAQDRKEDFIAKLLNFISESQFSAVLFLSGVDLSNRTDAQMMYASLSL